MSESLTVVRQLEPIDNYVYVAHDSLYANKLIQLGYLNIRNTKLISLPESIGGLFNLLTLILVKFQSNIYRILLVVI